MAQADWNAYAQDFGDLQSAKEGSLLHGYMGLQEVIQGLGLRVSHWGYLLGGSYDEDYSILWSILGSPK